MSHGVLWGRALSALWNSRAPHGAGLRLHGSPLSSVLPTPPSCLSSLNEPQEHSSLGLGSTRVMQANVTWHRCLKQGLQAGCLSRGPFQSRTPTIPTAQALNVRTTGTIVASESSRQARVGEHNPEPGSRGHTALTAAGPAQTLPSCADENRLIYI